MTNRDFEKAALQTFRKQYKAGGIYRQYADAVRKTPAAVQTLTDLPFLPVSFFKTHRVGPDPECKGAEAIFTSSGTTGADTSRHLVPYLALYEESFLNGFEAAYGPVTDWVILALLPAYLERSGSSLVYMAEQLIQRSGHPESGFYLYDHAALARQLSELEARGQQTLLLGVTFALLDFAEAFARSLTHTVVMETGGMKGRKKELTRGEVHELLKHAFRIPQVHSEYGMTEMLSQAYAKSDGLFTPSATMRVLVREAADPFSMGRSGSGVLNVIDLSNQDSCAFLATEDLGVVYPDGRFEVRGRLDHSALRGCSLLTV
ncbi:MAG: acyl transferase [Sphingobacteriales bacterium]|nr:MAG: acyl transferase [Sphingobacteriales bacterium]